MLVDRLISVPNFVDSHFDQPLFPPRVYCLYRFAPDRFSSLGLTSRTKWLYKRLEVVVDLLVVGISLILDSSRYLPVLSVILLLQEYFLYVHYIIVFIALSYNIVHF